MNPRSVIQSIRLAAKHILITTGEPPNRLPLTKEVYVKLLEEIKELNLSSSIRGKTDADHFDGMRIEIVPSVNSGSTLRLGAYSGECRH